MKIVERIQKPLILMVIVLSSIASAEVVHDADGWFRLAVAEREAENTAQAAAALEKAEQMGFSVARVGMERARLAVLEGQPDEAVAQLQTLVDGGLAALTAITGDPLLSRLAGHEGFDQLIQALRVRSYPCEHDAAFAAFDFWVGAWEVHVANGTYAGSNLIDKAQHGCVLIENWSSASGGSGMSVNYLDKASGEWVQVWNDGGGNQINIRGGLTDDGMLLVGTIHYVATGTSAPFRGLWTPLDDGRVRQFFEQSNDGGTTWSTWFEGFYTRK